MSHRVEAGKTSLYMGFSSGEGKKEDTAWEVLQGLYGFIPFCLPAFLALTHQAAYTHTHTHTGAHTHFIKQDSAVILYKARPCMLK